MRSLNATLTDFDLGQLRIIAEAWGIDLVHGNVRQARAELAAAMRSPIAAEVTGTLTPDERQALGALQASPGARLPWAAFVRRFGKLREMGPGRRDREAPWRAPVSATEALWYRGLIGRAFADSPQGPQEFAYLPSDLQAWLASPDGSLESEAGLPLQPSPLPAQSSLRLATTAVVDDACTLLAALRVHRAVRAARAGPSPAWRDRIAKFCIQPDAFDLTLALLIELKLVSGPSLALEPRRVPSFLKADRSTQLDTLAGAWRGSRAWVDLLRMRSLQAEGGAWTHSPVAAREQVLDLVNGLPAGRWYQLDEFVATVKAHRPDFQRAGGAYDAWALRDAGSGEYLRGIEHWERVEGALLRYLIAGPLHWLGAVDVADTGETRAVAFRPSRFMAAVAGKTGAQIAEPVARLRVEATGSIQVPRAVKRHVRFQVARIAEWTGLRNAPARRKAAAANVVYAYRLSPASLAAAAEQGITVKHVLAFLRKASGAELPRSIATALARADRAGGEAKLQSVVVLQVKSPDVLTRLRQSPAARRCLGPALGELAVEVRRRDWHKLVEAAAEAGILLDVDVSDE